MIRHIVLWKFLQKTDEGTKEENLRTAMNRLESLKGKIPQILALEVGLDVTHAPQSYDLVLNTLFDSPAALAAYQAHPEHARVVEFLRKVHGGRAVVDYEIVEV